MGRFDKFVISLQKQIYFAGETLIGAVNIKLKEKIRINGINLMMTGDARVHWTETSNRVQSTKNGLETVHYSASEDYIKLNFKLLDKQPSKDLYLEIGEHSFPFQLILPSNIPTSFEHQFGRIRYSFSAEIDIPCFDLNMNPSLRHPIGVSETEFLCCGLCMADPITASFNVYKGGYVSGEKIIFNASIENKSDKEIKKLSVSLLQNIQFVSTRPKKTKNCFRNVASVIYPKTIPQYSTETWNSVVLLIPPIISSSNGSCKIIDISYTLVLNFDASGVLISTNIPIPITIGTIPLNLNAPKQTKNKNTSQVKAESSSTHSNTSLQVATPSPTYASCIFDHNAKPYPATLDTTKKNEVYQTDSSSFKPFYPYYKDFTSINSVNPTRPADTKKLLLETLNKRI